MKKKFIKYLTIYVSIVILFLLLLYVSSLIPSDYLRINVKKSANILEEQTNSYIINTRGLYILVDNYTDSLMVNTAYSIDSKQPLYSFLVARKNYIPGTTKIIYGDSVGELKSSSKYEELNQVGDLVDTINEETYESFEYARYWHGYLVFLRPLLLFFDISTIRILNIILFVILGLVLLYFIYKKIGLIESIIVLLSLLAIDYLYIGLSLQVTSIFLITIIASIFILVRFSKINDIYILFFIVGCISSYLDFLTVPIISLGVPMTIYFLLKQKEENISLKETVKYIIFICINWAFGYFIIWFTKWSIVDLLYNKKLIYTSINQLLYRIGVKYPFRITDVIFKNVSFVFYNILFNIILGFIIILLKKKRIKFKVTKLLPYLVIFVLPFLWYILLRNHSYIHAGFTYRNLLLALVTIPLIFLKLVEK